MTPSSKNMRMPALIRSNSETGKSLKENRYRLSPLTSSALGQVAFWRTERNSYRRHPPIIEYLRSAEDYKCHTVRGKKSYWIDWNLNLPIVCTSLSGHSLRALHQTSLWCSGYKGESNPFKRHSHSTHQQIECFQRLQRSCSFVALLNPQWSAKPPNTPLIAAIEGLLPN